MAEKFPGPENIEEAKIIEEIENKEESKEKEPINKDGISNEALSRVEDFNLSSEDLVSIEGFKDLSEGRQILVIENLKQLTLAKIEDDAKDKHEEDLSESKFLQKIYKKISKRYQLAKKEKQSKEEILEGGLEEHQDLLVNLVEGAKEGPSVELKEDGTLELHYLSVEDLAEDNKELIENFNNIADKFSKIPKEWSYESTATKEQVEEYNKTKELYELERDKILAIAKEEKGEIDGALFVNNKLDAQVKMNQFLNSNPDVEKALQGIDDERLWTKLIPQIASERGLYFAGGFAARSVTVSMLGLIAAPVTASVFGGLFARKRAKEQLKTQEEAMRKGREEKGEAKNFVDAESLNKKMELNWVKLQEIVSNFDEETEGSQEERAGLISSMKARITYTQRKIEEGLVNYGKSDESYQNQYKLLQNLSKSSSLIEYVQKGKARGFDLEKDLEARLDRFLDYKGKKIDKAQKGYVRKQIVIGASMGAGFALAGWGFRHLADGYFGWGSGTNIESSDIGLTSKSPEEIQPLETIEDTKTSSENVEVPAEDSSKVSTEDQEAPVEKPEAPTEDQEEVTAEESETPTEEPEMPSEDQEATTEEEVSPEAEVELVVGTVKEGGSLWQAGRDLVESGKITEDEFIKYWSSDASMVELANGESIHISEAGLSYSGTELVVVPAEGDTPAHFEVRGKVGSNEDLAEAIGKESFTESAELSPEINETSEAAPTKPDATEQTPSDSTYSDSTRVGGILIPNYLLGLESSMEPKLVDINLEKIKGNVEFMYFGEEGAEKIVGVERNLDIKFSTGDLREYVQPENYGPSITHNYELLKVFASDVETYKALKEDGYGEESEFMKKLILDKIEEMKKTHPKIKINMDLINKIFKG